MSISYYVNYQHPKNWYNFKLLKSQNLDWTSSSSTSRKVFEYLEELFLNSIPATVPEPDPEPEPIRSILPIFSFQT